MSTVATTPADRALALMHSTPNGGLAVLSGKGDVFEEIPCEHYPCSEQKTDYYVYEGEDQDLILAIVWEGEEFCVLDEIPDEAIDATAI